MGVKSNDCFVVQDLMKLYAEQITSEVTTKYIKEHICSCRQCTKAFNNVLREEDERKREETNKDRKFVSSIIRYRYQMIGFVIGVLIPIFILFGREIYSRILYAIR